MLTNIVLDQLWEKRQYKRTFTQNLMFIQTPKKMTQRYSWKKTNKKARALVQLLRNQRDFYVKIHPVAWSSQ
ncbi:hypothetical protein DPMN_185022 [Dreissena polymorpha]|uniref:Uncharacterized protein n=1 Tax=Dreissena polymorpha TaxID=45954 RepID=A0A9D4DKM6_DREPO|nr:hypothetical protein DPMN_185022 [Dreissena polymorpha]